MKKSASINSLQSDKNFSLIWDKALKDVNTLQLTEASLPSKRERLAKILSVN